MEKKARKRVVAHLERLSYKENPKKFHPGKSRSYSAKVTEESEKNKSKAS